jgi:heavy metal translocating P-type ATPase
MLLEQTGADDPERFRETDVYRRCVEAGVIPGSLEDLEKRRGKGTETFAEEDGGDKSAMLSGESLDLELKIEGMWCPACAWVIAEGLRKAPGISGVECLFSMDRVRLSYDPVVTSPRAVNELIARLGYRAFPPGDRESGRLLRKEWLRLGISAFLTMNIMMLSFALYSGFFTELPGSGIASISWPIAVMAAFVFFYGGAPIHRKAVSGLAGGTPGMEALISIGSASAFVYSIYNWLQGSIHLYFDTTSMLITLVLVGKMIESRARGRVQAQLGSFFSLQPTKARILSSEFPLGRYADIGNLQRGASFRALSGETLPADGRILDGRARIDESSLTGEARPVVKGTGDLVSGGSRVIEGDITVKATAVGRESMLGQLGAIMEEALEKKSGIEDLTDRVLRFFVPCVILLALATGALCLVLGLGVGESWTRAITVMVISCPCALGVAIPLARVAGISLAGRAGVLVHDFSAFERIREIRSYIFDKTGTLTKGTWELLEVRPLEGRSAADILAMASGIEEGASHYVGEAIVDEAKKRKILPASAEDVETFANGVSANVGGRRVLIGAAEFVAGAYPGIGVLPGESGPTEEDPVSSVYMAVDGNLAAVFLFGDRIRASSAALVTNLKERGAYVSLISGDGEQAALYVGTILGIPICRGGMKPVDKAAFVDNARKQAGPVAMVGDGVNDVPALAASDLGIAVPSGRRIGNEASAITLMKSEPGQIMEFYGLAARVTQTVRQNLLFSLMYNTVSIPLAMSGLLNPLVAVSAMMLSSLSVTGNTLRLSMQGKGSERRGRATGRLLQGPLVFRSDWEKEG